MKFHKNFSLLCIAFLAFTSLLGVVIYDFVGFRPYQANIKDMLRMAHPLHKVPSKAVLDLISLSEGHNQIKNYVAQHLLARFELDNRQMLWWHIEYSLWTFLMSTHYSDHDIFTLWLELALYEEGCGLNNSANYHYGHNLNQLNPEELATVVTIARSPSLYKADPKKLKERVNILLDRYRTNRGWNKSTS